VAPAATGALTVPVVPVAAAAVAAGAYAAARVRLHRRGTAWPARRDFAATAGVACALAATASPLAGHDEQFPVHTAQHLLLGMAVPLLIALSAPVTLALRAGGGRFRTALRPLLGSRALRGLLWPPVPAVAVTASLWLLYLTPLYAATLRHPLLHQAVHAHALLSGWLLATTLVRAEPLPGRASLRLRAGCLAAVWAAHDALAKYLYGHAAVLAAPDTGSVRDWRLGAQLLWYGGDLVELALAVALFATWYAAQGRRHARHRRRVNQPGLSTGLAVPDAPARRRGLPGVAAGWDHRATPGRVCDCSADGAGDTVERERTGRRGVAGVGGLETDAGAATGRDRGVVVEVPGGDRTAAG
jgi:putative membrane protein